MDVVCRPDGSLKSLLTKFLSQEQQSELIQALNMQVDDMVLLAAGDHKRVVGSISGLLWEWNVAVDFEVTCPLSNIPDH